MADGSGALQGRQQGPDGHQKMVVELLLIPDVVAQGLGCSGCSHPALREHCAGCSLHVMRIGRSLKSDMEEKEILSRIGHLSASEDTILQGSTASLLIPMVSWVILSIRQSPALLSMTQPPQ